MKTVKRTGIALAIALTFPPGIACRYGGATLPDKQ